MLASFCAANGYDLLMADKKAYAPWLEQGAKEVRVSLFSDSVLDSQTGNRAQRF